MPHLLLLGKTQQPCMAGIDEAPPLFFSRNTSDYFYSLKIIITVSFFSNIFTKPQNMKITSHVWLEIAPLENFFAF